MIKEHLKKIIVIGVILIAGIYFFSGSDEPEKKAPTKNTAKTVEHPTLAAVAKGYIEIEGGISNISANLSGIITAVHVNVGDVVTKGQVLATQEDQAERLALKEANNNLENQQAQIELSKIRLTRAERDLARLQPLFEIGAVTSNEFDNASDSVTERGINLQQALFEITRRQNAIEKAEFNLEQRSIKAPVSGRIVAVEARPGVGASTQNISSLFTLIPDADYLIKAKVDGSLSDAIFVGQKATVTSKYDKKTTYDAVVTNVNKFFTAVTSNNSRNTPIQQLEVTLRMIDKSLMIGQEVQVRILKEKAAE